MCIWCIRQVSVHVITNDLLPPLTRLVTSLQNSHFLGDEVHLSFHVDVHADEGVVDYLAVREWGRKSP